MKKYFLLFLFLVFVVKINAQKVQSSCIAHDSIIAKYRNDADRMALRHVIKVQSDYLDSASIPRLLSDTVLKALIAVYNAKSVPARDTVVALRRINTFQQPVLNGFYMAADSTLKWMIKIRKDSLPTGVDSIDWLMKFYHLHVARYYRVKGFSYHIVIFECDKNYNLDFITNIFDHLSGVHFASKNKVEGDGNDITGLVTKNYVELVYSYGWGDCKTFCTFKRHWKFRVYYDCSVEYMGSYGSKWIPGSLTEIAKNDIAIQPNPFKDKINISNIPSAYEYKLFNSLGQIVRTKTTDEIQISNLEELKAGMYFLQINTGNSISNFKLIKE